MNTELSKIRVAVVDDDPEFRQLVRDTLSREPDLALVGEFGSAAGALAELPSLGPEVVLMDIEMPKFNGIECVRRLQPLMPLAPFMMLTVFEDYERIFESLRAGAKGYLLKRGVAIRLAEAIRELHAGESPISPSIARKVIQAFIQPDPVQDLSLRERDVLQRLASGRHYKEIAADLGVSFHTVRTHVGRIYEKLQVHSRRQAVAKLRRPGITNEAAKI